MMSGLVMGRYIPAEYIMIIANIIILIGVALLSTLPVHHPIPQAEFGYEVITGAGLGLASPPPFLILKTSVAGKDIGKKNPQRSSTQPTILTYLTASATGALNMFRTLGGCIGVAICSALLHSSLRSELPTFLSPTQVFALDSSIASLTSLPPETAARVSTIFGHSYNKQFRVLIAFAAANVVVAVLLVFARKRSGIFGLPPDVKKSEENSSGQGPQMEELRGGVAVADNGQEKKVETLGQEDA
jgi:hypothetical protein